MDGLTFNGKHSYRDFGLIITERDIGYPSKIKNTERVPYSNIDYDFSGIYGGQEYTERQLKYTFTVMGHNHTKQEYYSMATSILRWLFSINQKSPLTDDLIPNCYFMAEAVNEPSGDFIRNFNGTLEVVFTAYPFMVNELPEGNDIWDSFNFYLDYAQDTSFTVNGSLDVTVYNSGVEIVYPKIVASTSMRIVRGNTTYNIPVGSTTSYDFPLLVGENKFKVVGSGKISFGFYKELM